MTTYRERRDARAERLREWANGREAKAAARSQAAHELVDGMPLGQPILVGHHSEGAHRRRQAKLASHMDSSIEHSTKAEEMRRKADNIEAAADKAIYNDDPDAVPRLRRRIEDAEGLREEVKNYNFSVRKGLPDESLLGLEMLKNLHEFRTLRGVMRPDGQLPTHLTTNLSGNINRLKKRLASFERKSQS